MLQHACVCLVLSVTPSGGAGHSLNGSLLSLSTFRRPSPSSHPAPSLTNRSWSHLYQPPASACGCRCDHATAGAIQVNPGPPISLVPCTPGQATLPHPLLKSCPHPPCCSAILKAWLRASLTSVSPRRPPKDLSSDHIYTLHTEPPITVGT